MAKYGQFILILVFAINHAYTKPNNFITKDQLASLFQDFKDELFNRLTLQESRDQNRTNEIAKEFSERLDEFQETFNDTLDNRFEPGFFNQHLKMGYYTGAGYETLVAFVQRVPLKRRHS